MKTLADKSSIWLNKDWSLQATSKLIKMYGHNFDQFWEIALKV